MLKPRDQDCIRAHPTETPTPEESACCGLHALEEQRSIETLLRFKTNSADQTPPQTYLGISSKQAATLRA